MTDQKTQMTVFHREGFTELEDIIVDAILDRKGQKIKVLDLKELESSPARSFIICQGKSTSQVSSIADHIREQVREKLGIKSFNFDGYRNSQWIIIDYGDIMVHVFLPEFREYYNIEDLWSDSKIVEIPDLD